MKNKLKFLLKGILFSSLFLSCIFSIAQNPTITLNATTPLTGLTPGATVSFQVIVNVPSDRNLSNFTMMFNYDRDVLKHISTIQDSYFSAAGGSWSARSDYKHNIAPFDSLSRMSWSKQGGTVGLPCSNQVLYTMNFKFNGGVVSFPIAVYVPNVNPTGSRVATNLSTSTGLGTYNYSSTWVGSYTVDGSYADITSVVAGGNWATGTSWDLGHAPNNSNGNVIINSSTNPLVIAANVTWPRNVKINPAGKLTVNTGIAFSLGGDMSIDGDGSGTGSFADKGTTNIAGTSTVKRYMFGDWIPNNTLYSSHLVSSPVAAQSNVIFEGSLMNKWNEVAYNWDPMTVPFETMEVGKGYAVSPASPGITATFTGALNTGNITISGLTLTNNSGINSGFNLVGNPFASAIKWETGITMINLNSNAWVWNGGAYISYAMNGGDFIPAEQAFFVQATGNGSLMIPNSVRNHGGTFYKSGNPNWLTLRVEGNNYWDRAQLIINPLASVAYEREYDAIKLMGSPVAPQLYCILPDAKLSINSLPDLDESSVIKLGFKSGAEGNFTISVQDLETFTASNEFYLVDLLTNTTQNLKTNPVYTFNAAPGQLEHRFNLTFSTVGIGEVGSAKLNIYAVEKVVNVEIPAGVKGDIVVYNLLGSEIARKAVEANSLNKINLNVPSGYYLVKVNGVSYTANGKVFIK